MILVVDDHADMRALLVRLLKMDHLESIAVAGGEEALLFLKTFIPRVILLDYGMPDMNGLEVTRELKKDSRLSAIPIILFTAHGNDLEEAALAAGVSSFVQKGSLDWLKLREEIVRVMDLPSPVPHKASALERAQS